MFSQQDSEKRLRDSLVSLGDEMTRRTRRSRLVEWARLVDEDVPDSALDSGEDPQDDFAIRDSATSEGFSHEWSLDEE